MGLALRPQRKKGAVLEPGEWSYREPASCGGNDESRKESLRKRSGKDMKWWSFATSKY